MYDGKDIIILSKDEVRILLELIHASFGRVTKKELKTYQKHGALDLVDKLKWATKEDWT